MKRTLYLLLVTVFFFSGTDLYSQGFMKKLKDKVNKTVDKAMGLDGDTKPTTSTGTSVNNETNIGNTSSGGKAYNKGGGGLSNTAPPDVNVQMSDAETAHKAKNYSDARYSLQQALIGVEIQLGKQILKSLPSTVSVLSADTLQDKVMSTQWGWSNLTIQRVYKNNAEKEMTVNIGNAGMYAGIANMYFTNANMIESNGGKQNIKQVRVKGNKAIIEYEDSKGYTLMVPLGQSSMIVWECVNFGNEQEVMTTANSFDIDGIKKMLGEQ